MKYLKLFENNKFDNKLLLLKYKYFLKDDENPDILTFGTNLNVDVIRDFESVDDYLLTGTIFDLKKNGDLFATNTLSLTKKNFEKLQIEPLEILYQNDKITIEKIYDAIIINLNNNNNHYQKHLNIIKNFFEQMEVFQIKNQMNKYNL